MRARRRMLVSRQSHAASGRTVAPSPPAIFKCRSALALSRIAGLADRHLLADAGHHVLQRPLARAHDNGRRWWRGSCRRWPPPAGPAARSAPHRRRDTDSSPRHGAATARRSQAAAARLRKHRDPRRPGDEGDAFRCSATSASVSSHSPFSPASCPGSAAATAGHSRRGPRVSEQARRIGQVQPAADQRPHSRFLGGAVHPHHPGQRVAVGDRRSRPCRACTPPAPARSRPTRRAGSENGRGHAQLDKRRRRDRLGAARRGTSFFRAKFAYSGISRTARAGYHSGAPPRPSPITPSR